MIWDLLVAGLSRADIGRRIGYVAPARLSTAVDSALARHGVVDEVDVPLALQIARLDHLQASWWHAANEGDLAAAALVQRIIEHRSALLGLVADQAAGS
jgi:hypothetical protein